MMCCMRSTVFMTPLILMPTKERMTTFVVRIALHVSRTQMNITNRPPCRMCWASESEMPREFMHQNPCRTPRTQHAWIHRSSTRGGDAYFLTTLFRNVFPSAQTQLWPGACHSVTGQFFSGCSTCLKFQENVSCLNESLFSCILCGDVFKCSQATDQMILSLALPQKFPVNFWFRKYQSDGIFSPGKSYCEALKHQFPPTRNSESVYCFFACLVLLSRWKKLLFFLSTILQKFQTLETNQHFSLKTKNRPSEYWHECLFSCHTSECQWNIHFVLGHEILLRIYCRKSEYDCGKCWRRQQEIRKPWA